MNSDAFENELCRQPLRSLPPEWRGEVLAQVRPPAVPTARWWWAWIWPHPRAWVALAATWVVIAVLSLAGRPDSEPPAQAAAERLAAAALLAQGAQTRQFAEYFRPPPPPPILVPPRRPTNLDQGWISRPAAARA